MGIAKRFSRSEVKGQGHEQTERCYGGDMYFDCVASTFTCVALVHFRTLVTLQRVRVRVGLELRLGLVRVRIKVRVRLGLDLGLGLC